MTDSRAYALLSTIVLAIVVTGFVLHVREFDTTTERPRSVFTFGPVVGSVYQHLKNPGLFLTRVDVSLNASHPNSSSIPTNLRLLDESGRVLAETKVDVRSANTPGIYSLTCPPLTNQFTTYLDLELQRAEESIGDLLIPIHIGQLPGRRGVTDHDGTIQKDWAIHVKLFRTLRPIAYAKEIWTNDWPTAIGAVAAMFLVAVTAAAGFRYGGASTYPATLLGISVTVGIVWIGFAILPAT